MCINCTNEDSFAVPCIIFRFKDVLLFAEKQYFPQIVIRNNYIYQPKHELLDYIYTFLNFNNIKRDSIKNVYSDYSRFTVGLSYFNLDGNQLTCIITPKALDVNLPIGDLMCIISNELSNSIKSYDYIIQIHEVEAVFFKYYPARD